MNDQEFLTAFESCTLPFEQWDHRAHVRVAFLYASAHKLDVATSRMREGIKAYNKTNEVPEAVDRGYHEAITVAFMKLVGEATAVESVSFEKFEQRFPQLFDKRVLLQLYSRDRIISDEAKTAFMEPDLKLISLAATTGDSP